MPDEELRGAAARKAQVAAAPRPQQLGATSDDIREAVSAVRETEDTWKVYRKEWQIKFVSTAVGTAGMEEASAFFEKKYAGRVEDDDVRYQVPIPENNPEDQPVYLELNLWNVKGEWKHSMQAQAHAAEVGDAVVVGRNSREEHNLKDYGIKKLVGVRQKLEGA